MGADFLDEQDVGIPRGDVRPRIAEAELAAVQGGDADCDAPRFGGGRLALRYILHTNTVIPIPGINDVAHVDNAAKAVVERRTLDVKERAELEDASRKMWANLPKNYQWLKNWEYV